MYKRQTDFTQIDPHLGTNDDMKALIKAAHRKGMKVFFDIITNHTADVIDYEEKQYTYRSKKAYPYEDAAGEPFDEGHFAQQLHLPGIWLERGTLDGADRLLMDSPLGLAGHSVMATLWLADGAALGRERSEQLIDSARALVADSALPLTAGVSAPHPSLLVLRALGHRVEPVMALLQAVWAAWRQQHWGLKPCAPRVWRT